MNNTIGLSFPNYAPSDPAAYSGQFIPEQPAGNIASRIVSKVARSMMQPTEQTQMTVELGAVRTIQVIAVVSNAIDNYANSTIQVYCHDADGFITYTSDEINLDLPYGDYSAAEYNWARVPAYRYHAIVVLPTPMESSRVTIKMRGGISQGALDVGRIFLGPLWTPTINAAYGLQDYVLDPSTSSRAESGSLWPVDRIRIRGVKFALSNLTKAEGDFIHDFILNSGVSQEVVYIPNTDDRALIIRYGFLGKLQELSPLDYPAYRLRSSSFKIQAVV